LIPKLTDFTKGRTYCAAICLIVATANLLNIKQKDIAEKSGFSTVTIRKQAQELLSFLGFNSLKEIKGKVIR